MENERRSTTSGSVEQAPREMPPPEEAAPRKTFEHGAARRRVALAAFAVAAFTAAVAAQQTLHWYSDPGRYDGSPADRPEINAPFITSDDAVVEKMVEMAELSPSDMVYDLGCGDGRIVIAAAVRSGCKGLGVDIDPKLVAQSIENARRQGVADRVSFRIQDVFTVDLSKADAVMMFLLPWMLAKLDKQFDQMRPGSRIVTSDFWLEQVRPDRIAGVASDDGQSPHVIYLYTTPLARDKSMEVGRPPTEKDLRRAGDDATHHLNNRPFDNQQSSIQAQEAQANQNRQRFVGSSSGRLIQSHLGPVGDRSEHDLAIERQAVQRVVERPALQRNILSLIQ